MFFGPMLPILNVLSPPDPQRQRLVLRVASGSDKIIARSEAQSAFCVLHGEIFKMRIRISP